MNACKLIMQYSNPCFSTRRPCHDLVTTKSNVKGKSGADIIEIETESGSTVFSSSKVVNLLQRGNGGTYIPTMKSSFKEAQMLSEFVQLEAKL